MNGPELIDGFYAAIARDLQIYIACLGAFAVLAWIWWAVARNGIAAATAIMLTVGGAGLSVAAVQYIAGLPDRIAVDSRKLAQDPQAARAEFVRTYGFEQAFGRFSRLALLWTVLIAGSAVAILVFKGGRVMGLGMAVALLSAVTFVLDGLAFRRDLAYSAAWSAAPASDLLRSP